MQTYIITDGPLGDWTTAYFDQDGDQIEEALQDFAEKTGLPPDRIVITEVSEQRAERLLKRMAGQIPPAWEP